MLEEIKKIQGINNDDFDTLITNYIQSCKIDLECIGINKKLIDTNDSLIETAIITYVLSFLDVDNAQMYADSYALQKDTLRKIGRYISN